MNPSLPIMLRVSREGDNLPPPLEFPHTKEEFEAYRAKLESKGFTVVTKWRKGLKSIQLSDIVLSEPQEALPNDNGSVNPKPPDAKTLRGGE